MLKYTIVSNYRKPFRANEMVNFSNDNSTYGMLLCIMYIMMQHL